MNITQFHAWFSHICFKLGQCRRKCYFSIKVVEKIPASIILKCISLNCILHWTKCHFWAHRLCVLFNFGLFRSILVEIMCAYSVQAPLDFIPDFTNVSNWVKCCHKCHLSMKAESWNLIFQEASFQHGKCFRTISFSEPRQIICIHVNINIPIYIYIFVHMWYDYIYIYRLCITISYPLPSHPNPIQCGHC